MDLRMELSEVVIPCLEDGRLNVPMLKIQALADGVQVGRMLWHLDSGEIEKLWVAESWRRQGIATRMWEMAQHAPIKATHSAWRTNDGDAWAMAMGGDLPPRLQT
jgi:ribosomal protein S18 acetylase RimI-like enzyme